jgi:hypothetical protein
MAAVNAAAGHRTVVAAAVAGIHPAAADIAAGNTSRSSLSRSG